jgi:hypothetical protein
MSASAFDLAAGGMTRQTRAQGPYGALRSRRILTLTDGATAAGAVQI